MENTNDSLQKNIQALVNGELDEKKREALLNQAQADPEVADELHFSQSLALALRHSELVAASTILNAVINEEGYPPPTTPGATTGGRKWWVWTGAAVLFLASLAGAYFWAQNTGLFASATQKMAREALEPLEIVLFLPTDGQALTDLKQGMEAYEAARYADAARSLERYVRQNPDNSARVYLGVAQLMHGRSREAIPPLAEAAQSQVPPIRETALWYLALAYLEQDNPTDATRTLKAIPPDGIYGAQAREVLKKLK